ncbi:MAG TPA: four helix bundle protein [Elusimicrobiota bacterium]|nr:four helix bundle protein [Elusimicrobiota bacterium]
MGHISWNDGQAIFQKAHVLASEVYRSTRTFPISEGSGLVYEMRQSSLAISAFLSDALRKDQKSYLVDVLETVLKHLADLRRNVVVSRFLTYLSDDDFEKLDRLAEVFRADVETWKESLDTFSRPGDRRPGDPAPTRLSVHRSA